MKFFITFILILNALLVAADKESNNSQQKSRVEKQVEKQMQKEKKYSKEQKFYQSKNYDLRGAEVNQDSLDSIPEIEVDDFNMDSVYD